MPTAERIAFVCPRFPQGPAVGGAETLLKNLALQAARAGRSVTYLTTCAKNHFTWENELPPGRRRIDGMDVEFFPVDTDRDVSLFLRCQERIARGGAVEPEDEAAWLRHSVGSRALYAHLRRTGDAYDRILMGPYLFGLTYFASRIHPRKTVLVPCLHDEPFAYLNSFRDMARDARLVMFNSEPERDLAVRLFGPACADMPVVGMGLDPFPTDAAAFLRRRRLPSPYLIYAGRREPLKGTPLLLDYFQAFRSRTARPLALVLCGTGPIHIPHSVARDVFDLGFLSESEKHDAMAGALVFCHPSTRESLGIVALEAWLAGTPCLVHAGSEVLRYHCRRGQCGLWFRTYPEFEEELLLLLRYPEARSELGRRGQDYVRKQYDWSAVAPRLLRAVDR